ncbi:H/ACA ribonucleoprotein complex non-core subunit NAF1-like protein [Dinothrombium tinctorium]|uniref:H/ACA ribonucleoprotein complex subunit n=1 Tax=Dinothrombium tinctorium TaxID=1965070 RepID=A0A3S3PXU8_9ACAR|nr:H/ACA ribonucleoprotein complex non-core subunit NAF1-like protein [Dinothrombium tinctorium]
MNEIHEENEERLRTAVLETLNQLLSTVEFEALSENAGAYRVKNEEMIDISSHDDSSSSSLFSSSEIEDNDSETEACDNVSKQELVKKMPRTKGELTVYDLPPIETLSIEVSVEQLFHIGRVASIVDILVVVQSFKRMPVMNLDSILFLKDCKPLGRVFDVFGPVVEPLYSVRFNSEEEIKQRDVVVDMPVYIAPDYQSPITDYVFYQHLLAMKGSDASWKHNHEPPEEFLDFSDDEEERMSKLKAKAKRKRNALSPAACKVPPNTPSTPYQQVNGNQGIKQNSSLLQVID